ncbi:MAG TPA: maleylpyruvate isomerase family mycothiol-dependent enzyme [Candidatus Dormibacteraeota bacterium]|nr:maleylpyruvate isomerase family mycothiol-dependent enzyme [Candidatus Dormibacteraeota bacterium]
MAVPTTLADVRLVAALTRSQSESLASVLEGLTAEQWRLACCGDWTVDQVTGHLGIVPSSVEQWYDAAQAGEEVEPVDLRDPEFQETQLDMIGEADPSDRIEGIRYAYAAAADYLDALDPATHELPTYTPEGTLPLRLAGRINLSELVVHGVDVRRAAGLDDRVDAEVAQAVLPHTLAVLPAFVTGATGTEAVELRTGDGTWTLTPAAVEEGSSGAAATLRIDPGDLVLLTWGRISLAGALERGAVIEGDAAAVERLLGGLDPL